MATIKGQNIRLFIGTRCVAAATNCTLHVAAQVEDCSTKDSEGDWAENEVTGLSWDVSTDALVLDGYKAVTIEAGDQYLIPSKEIGVNYKVAFIAPKNSVKIIARNKNNNSEAEIICMGALALVSLPLSTLLYDNYIRNVSSEAITVLYRMGNINEWEDFDFLAVGQRVGVVIEQTSGEGNRERLSNTEENYPDYYDGYAYITDFSLNASNRQKATISVQLTGDGDLKIESY